MRDIPPLGMVDDLLCITECGHKSAMMNAYINFKTNSKKLQFGVDKCKKLHIGNVQKPYKCQDLVVDKWSEVELKNCETHYRGEELLFSKNSNMFVASFQQIYNKFLTTFLQVSNKFLTCF